MITGKTNKTIVEICLSYGVRQLKMTLFVEKEQKICSGLTYHSDILDRCKRDKNANSYYINIII